MATPTRIMAYTGQYDSSGDPTNHREDKPTYTYLLSNPIQAEEPLPREQSAIDGLSRPRLHL